MKRITAILLTLALMVGGTAVGQINIPGGGISKPPLPPAKKCKTCGKTVNDCQYKGHHPPQKKCKTCGKVVNDCQYKGKHPKAPEVYDVAFTCNAYDADLYIDGEIQRIFTSEDGLLSTSTQAVAQTREGFIWIGGYGGLVRYDGRGFKTFAYKRITRVSALAEKTEAALSETEKAAREVEQLFSGAETLQPEDLEALAAALRKLGEVDPDSLNRALRSLSELDVSGFRESMERLQSVDVDSLNAAIARLGEVDLDSLNEAITNLNDAVRPLAELARRLGG